MPAAKTQLPCTIQVTCDHDIQQCSALQRCPLVAEAEWSGEMHVYYHSISAEPGPVPQAVTPACKAGRLVGLMLLLYVSSMQSLCTPVLWHFSMDFHHHRGDV